MTVPSLQGGEGDLTQVSLSALEHYTYCPRQCGLILLEDAFTNDAATVRGTLVHQRVDTPGNRGRGTVRTLHALPVWHDGHGLTGICDTVELHADGTVLPVEHKSGRYHPGGPADVQVAAQAMCLCSDSVAVALRGGRGSQRVVQPHTDDLLGAWRSPSGAAEDRNKGGPAKRLPEGQEWRSPSGAAEDRNGYFAGVAEGEFGVAVALRGGRGSQLRGRHGRRHRNRRGGRPPWRPRIATACT